MQGQGAGPGADVPTRLEVPPEVAHAYTGIKISWKDKSDGKEGIIEIPLGGGTPLPDPSLVVRADVFLPAFTMGGGAITSEGRGAAESGGSDHRVRQGQGDLRGLDLHAISRRASLRTSALPAAPGGGSSEGRQMTREARRAVARHPEGRRPEGSRPRSRTWPLPRRHRGPAQRRQVVALQPPRPQAPLDRPRPSGDDAGRPRDRGEAARRAHVPAGRHGRLRPRGPREDPGGGARSGGRGHPRRGPRAARRGRVRRDAAG